MHSRKWQQGIEQAVVDQVAVVVGVSLMAWMEMKVPIFFRCISRIISESKHVEMSLLCVVNIITSKYLLSTATLREALLETH